MGIHSWTPRPAGAIVSAGGLMEATRAIPVTRFGRTGSSMDEVAVEEPLEIRLEGRPLAVVMRTPGHDMELAAGFCMTEGILEEPDHLGAIAHCRSEDNQVVENVVNVRLVDGVQARPVPARDFTASSSCGLCGKQSIDQLRVRIPQAPRPVRVLRSVVAKLESALAQGQPAFARSGALHAAGLFSMDGRQIAIREDIGRHNAVDKVVGHGLLREALPLAGTILMVSGRASFEIIQKAAVAGIPVVAGVSAPSSLAVDLAAEMGMTLIGFLRQGAFNVYTGQVEQD
jgi:FdhD protein